MSPSLRKNKDAAQPLVPSWHPNFRNYERLPDTKVVRTTFFINGLSVLVAIALLVAFAFQEYQLKALDEQLVSWDAQIQQDKQPSSQALGLFKKFQDEAKVINEVAAFTKSRLVVSDFILHLGETIPDNIAIRGFDFRDTGVTLRGVVRGAPDEASGRATAFVEQLRNDPVVAGSFASIDLMTVNRDAASGSLNIELALRLHSDSGKK